MDGRMASGDALDVDLSTFNIAEFLRTPHNARLYQEVQKLKILINELVDFQTAHPLNERASAESERQVKTDIEKKEKYVRAQLSVIKTLYRQSVLRVREEKANTADVKAVNDALILGLHNLKYEEQSLRSEISAAENYDHKYMKLPLISIERYLEEFPEHRDLSEHDLMTARIEHEHQVRLKLEERRQEKLKQKQKLIAEVKKGKDDLTKLDTMVEKFIEAAEPIKKRHPIASASSIVLLHVRCLPRSPDMVCIHVEAEVLALRSQSIGGCSRAFPKVASLPTPPNHQDLAENLETLHTLFAAVHHSDEHEEPPHKRRKINTSCNDGPQTAQNQADQDLVLAKVSINLDFTQSMDTAQSAHAVARNEKPLVLHLEQFLECDAGQFRIVLFEEATHANVDLFATTDVASLQIVKPHLKAIESLAYTRYGRKSRTKPRAAFARCSLCPSSETYKLDVEICWALGMSVVENPSVSAHIMKEDLRLLSRYFPGASVQADKRWALSDFYDSVYVPPFDLQISPQIQHKLADTMLYPFQQRAVDWLLRREGVAYTANGLLEPFLEDVPPASFNLAQDANGTACYVSMLRGLVVSDLNIAKGDTLQSLKGGILAEEMGLGKTVELIALITHHQRQVQDPMVFDQNIGAHVRVSGATLIITPPSILEQWQSEIHMHAPNLKVFHYKGLPPSTAPKKEHAAATPEELLRYDVVLTTYGVLSKEIHYATPPPDRSSRHERRHERRRSPLVDISWWRVCLDEAQMVESGVSNAAKVARVIPRCNAWAISGTPLRKDVQDLRGLLTFLRCDTFAQNKIVWSRLDKSTFHAIFHQITLRHTKDKVRNDLRLPPQKRAVITIPFTAIEEQNYADLVRQMCDECWLGPEGEPLNAESDPTSPETLERMREWLVRLRQTCLHAHVGRKNKRALGARNGPLRTVHEVLEIMIDQNGTRWKADAREMILNRIKMGHVMAYAGDVDNRAETSLPFYDTALEESKVYVSMCRQDLEQEQKRLGVSTGVLKHDEASDAEEAAERENMGNISALRRSLRSFLELEHMCKFFIATAHHQIKDFLDARQPETEQALREEQLETDWYDQAKATRRELLWDVKNATQRQMRKVEHGRPYHHLPTVDELPDLGGIESRRVLETIDEISDFLNAQAEKIQEWRMKTVEILLMRLTDDDDDMETTGEEYEISLKAQDELYVSIMALRTLVADRNLAIHGLRDNLIEEELRSAEKRALSKNEDEDKGHAPELLLEFVKQRRELMSTLHGGSLKGLIAEIRSKITPLQWRAENDDHRAAVESSVLQKLLGSVQLVLSKQSKVLLDLEKEQELFRGAMNQRLEYYRQFQHISDTVAAYKEKLDDKFDKATFQIFDYRRNKSLEGVTALKAKHAYLTNLRAEDQKSEGADCIICQETIEVGVLTTCGHKYCKECINQWWHAHRTCPLCKQKLRSSDFKDISLKPSEIPTKSDTPPVQSPQPASSPKMPNMLIYSDLSDTTLKEIKTIDLAGSYGSKIDMLAKHLLWIRANDPGAKSVVFSQYRDFLEVLETAFRAWKIGCSNIREKNGIEKFKRDPATEAFLLDAKSDSSGLNLVNATYVFLCEPLINPAIELQAIARVHRIGQHRQTTVFMYLIGNTVEEAIYDISVARRLAHMKSAETSTPEIASGMATPVAAQEKTLDKANSAEMEAAPLSQLLSKGGGGEAVRNDDLWQCLFGKPRRGGKEGVVRGEQQIRITTGL
ncbi:SNF2 family domain-containing protein [Stagonosporopsis vannaccii]|nr:SNF2 family domain-containing protein [Stagonosporopsis vannaccii]